MSNSSSLNAIRVASKMHPSKQAIIIFHGLGDSGNGWSFFADILQRDQSFANTRFVFPNAPVMNIVANGNYPMPAWFNIYEWNQAPKKLDTEGFLNSLNLVKSFVQEQIDDGIAPENIIVGGFSQGAALTLSSTLTLPQKIGGFLALSAFSPFNDKLKTIKNTQNIDTPVFHGHGDKDPLISLDLGLNAKDFYVNTCGLLSYQLEIYEGMDHSTCPREIDDVIKFIKRIYRL